MNNYIQHIRELVQSLIDNRRKVELRHLRHITNVDIDGIDMQDYPDFVDAFVAYAEWPSGTPLTDEQLEYINRHHTDWVYEHVTKQLY